MSAGIFIGNSILLGIGLAMDAFSVSVAHGLTDPSMRHRRAAGIAATFAAFQFLMPMIGWVCVHTVADRFTAFERIVPWIALILLTAIGIHMIREGAAENASGGAGRAADAEKAPGRNGTAPAKPPAFFLKVLLQGIATSIDALSVGFAIASYDGRTALAASLLIAAATWIICRCGTEIGKKAGGRLTAHASLIGGIILIGIGIEIFVRNMAPVF